MNKAEQERLDHLDEMEQAMSRNPREYLGIEEPVTAKQAQKPREPNVDALKRLVMEHPYSPDENEIVDIRLERTIQDVTTAECRVCKRTKEGVVFTDRRAGKIAFKDVFVCWDDLMMVTKKTKALGLFESKMRPRSYL